MTTPSTPSTHNPLQHLFSFPLVRHSLCSLAMPLPGLREPHTNACSPGKLNRQIWMWLGILWPQLDTVFMLGCLVLFAFSCYSSDFGKCRSQREEKCKLFSMSDGVRCILYPFQGFWSRGSRRFFSQVFLWTATQAFKAYQTQGLSSVVKGKRST